MLKAKKDLNYWKKKLLSVLKGDVIEKSLQDILYPGVVLKALEENLLLKARGFAPGTIRTWQGKDYKKLSSGKWMRTYTGTGERGERQAVRNVMRAIQGANSIEELAEIVNKNMQRFKDESGKTLPVVKEFMTAARGTEKGEKVVIKKDAEKELSKEEYENYDMRGKYFAIYKDGKHLTSGSSPKLAKDPAPIKHFLDMAKKMNGELYVSDSKIVDTTYDIGDIMGLTFEQISSIQQKRNVSLDTIIKETKEKAILYKQYDEIKKDSPSDNAAVKGKEPDKPIDTKKPTKIIVKKPAKMTGSDKQIKYAEDLKNKEIGTIGTIENIRISGFAKEDNIGKYKNDIKSFLSNFDGEASTLIKLIKNSGLTYKTPIAFRHPDHREKTRSNLKEFISLSGIDAFDYMTEENISKLRHRLK